MASFLEELKKNSQTRDPYMTGTPRELDPDRPRPMNLDGSINQGMADAADEGAMQRQDIAIDRHISGAGFQLPQIQSQVPQVEAQNTNSGAFSQGAAAQVNPMLAPQDLTASPQVPQVEAQIPQVEAQGPLMANDTQPAMQESEVTMQSPSADSPQANFEAQRATGKQFTPEEIAQAEALAKSMGTTFDPETGYSRQPFLDAQAPQVQAPAGEPTTQSGIPLSQFLSGEAIPEAGLRAEAPVFSSESRGISGVAGQDIMARASAEREARAEAQFGEARGPDSRDRDRRMASGEGTSMADLTDMAKANARGASPRDVARGQKIADELGVDLKTGQPLEVKTPDSITPMDAANIRKTEAETAKIMSEIDAKLASGTPLTEPERLARERFEYEKSQDAESTKLARERFEYEKSKEPAQAATDRNIERLMKANPDLSYSDAVNIEQGVVSKTVNPLTGATETTNIVSGESTPVTSTAPLQDSSLDLEPLEPGSSLFERGQKYTGAIESGLRGAQKVAGQFGGKVASDESVQTKKELDAFQGSLVRAFQEGDRFSTGQDKVLREELDATLGAMKDPETFKNNAIALDKVMRQRHADLMENYKNLSYKDDFRSDSLSKARVLENAIRDLGVTQDTGKGSAAGQTESVPIPEGVNKAFSQEMWDVLTPEERATLQGAK